MVGPWLLDRGLGGGCGRRREQFPQGAAGEQDAMGVMDDAVEDRVPEGGVPDQVVPVLDRDTEIMAMALLSSGSRWRMPTAHCVRAISMRGGSPSLSDETRQLRNAVERLERIRSPRARCVVTGVGLASHFPTSQRRAITPSSPLPSRDPR